MSQPSSTQKYRAEIQARADTRQGAVSYTHLVVVLEAGDSICADGRLLECASLKCAESALTGESLPVEKDLADIDGDVPLGDRKNMVFSGCFVTYGRAQMCIRDSMGIGWLFDRRKK